MKQGRASHDGPGGAKREPIPHAHSPERIAQIGIQTPYTKASDSGRGFTGPTPKGHTIHTQGSQGKR